MSSTTSETPNAVSSSVASASTGAAGFVGVFHFQKIAAVVEGPAVKRAGVGGFVAFFEAAQLRATVGAGVDKRVQLTLTVAGNHNRLAADVGGVIIVDVGNLGFVGEVNPVALENVFHFQLKQLFIGEGAAVQAVIAGFVVFD